VEQTNERDLLFRPGRLLLEERGLIKPFKQKMGMKVSVGLVGLHSDSPTEFAC